MHVFFCPEQQRRRQQQQKQKQQHLQQQQQQQQQQILATRKTLRSLDLFASISSNSAAAIY